MKKIILHIGMHKTGTSSIQKALKGYSDGTTRYANLGFENHSIPFYTAFSKHVLNYHIWTSQGLSADQIHRKRDEFRSAIEGTLSPNDDRTVIFSGEDISQLDDSEVAELAAMFRARSDHVSIYAYFRHPLDFMASNLQEDIKAGFRSKVVAPPNYRFRFAKFAEQFGEENIHLRLFDRSVLKDGDIVADFCNWIGINTSVTGTFEENTSISTEATRFLYLLNRSNALTSGEELLNGARFDVIRTLTGIFPGALKIPASILNETLDMADVEWMEKISGIDFRMQAADDTAEAHRDLNWFLEDISGASIDALLRHLKANGVNGAFDRDPTKLVNRLYYLAISNRVRMSTARPMA